jgi:hydrogenase maturation protein HypF
MRDRRKITVHGVVQGVGFRPFVYTLAKRFNLVGHVRNGATGVVIDLEGEPVHLEAFLQALVAEAPPLARIERVAAEWQPPRHYTTFVIEPSEAHDETDIFVAPDAATCLECLSEIDDPHSRRYRYPFLNCTNCGPRFTIVVSTPYDRERTTMAGFPMCPPCRAEYEAPHDRRFHAQPSACPTCGPQLYLTDAQGREIPDDDPLTYTSRKLREGKIVAVKGLGGYHIACDALRNEVVRELRRRKHREAKPLAIMVSDLDTARTLCRVSTAEAALLTSARRPIVVLRKHDGCPIAEEVAPRNRDLGVMLPYSPLHHLLLRHAARPLVMTSGNLTEEPIAYEDDDALPRLTGIADYFLTHNRPIHMRCDDSVTRVVLGREVLLRRARGYAPLPIRLWQPCLTPILACGGHLKNTFCLARGEYAFLSQHIGDLEDYRTYGAFVDGIEHFKKLFGIAPRAVAHDLHPGYLSSQYARSLGDLPRIAIQHHHAHIASCMAEHGCAGPVIGVAWDGTGYGADGHIWGGEFLVADYAHYERWAHLEEVHMPGGERAVRQPWRMAAAYLYSVYGPATDELELDFVHRLDPRAWGIIRQMMVKGVNSPVTSSAGRLFDAVAALVNLRSEVQYEGQAAVELERLADGAVGAEEYAFHIRRGTKPMILETQGIIKGVVDDLTKGEQASRIAAKFHNTLVAIILAVCCRMRELTSLSRVVLSGGVFQNALLLTRVVPSLQEHDFQVYTHSQVPPNDGGIALGQVAVANAMLAARC